MNSIAVTGVALAVLASLVILGLRILDDTFNNPKSRRYGRRWCRRKGLRYREDMDPETGRYVWWGEDGRGRHYRHGRN